MARNQSRNSATIAWTTARRRPLQGRWPVSSAAALGFALAAVLGLGGCRETPAEPNIVIIVQDTVRPDRLSAYGHPKPTSPFLDSFAASGVRFDRAYSSSSWTLPAHASLFTGTPPRIHRATQGRPHVEASLPLLAEELAEAGYQTAGFSANMWVSELAGLNRGFTHFENLNKGIYSHHVKELASDPQGLSRPTASHYVVSRVLSWLDEERDSSQPFFLFVNVVEPHLPYLPDWASARNFLPSRNARFGIIRRYYPGADPTRLLYRHYARENPLSNTEWEMLAAMYDGTLHLADRITQAIVTAVDEETDADHTLVFILSDHGENLGDHRHIGHFFNLYDSNLRILLAARGPGFNPGLVEAGPVQISDVHATALAAAGLTSPSNSSGHDLRKPLPEHRIVEAALDYPSISLDMFKGMRARHELKPYEVSLAAAVGPRYKVIRSTDLEGQLVAEEIYDILEDPGEEHPLVPGEIDSETLATLRAGITSAAITHPTDSGLLDDLDPETREGLRALGYVRDEEASE